MASKNKLTMPEGAVRAPLPERLSPFLATLVDGPPKNADEWIFEIKFDGYRMLTRVREDGSVRMFRESSDPTLTKWLGSRNDGRVITVDF